MDRHICGACNAEINDIDDFIVHKKKTCPALQHVNTCTIQDTGSSKYLETDFCEKSTEDLTYQHTVSSDVSSSRSNAAESSERLPETILQYQSALQTRICQSEHTTNTNEAIQNDCRSISQTNVDESHSNSSILSPTKSTELENEKATTQGTTGMQSLSKHSTLVSTNQNEAGQISQAAEEQCPQTDPYFSELDTGLVSRTHQKSPLDKLQVSLITVVTEGQTETIFTESSVPLVINASSCTSDVESNAISDSCAQSDATDTESHIPLVRSTLPDTNVSESDEPSVIKLQSNDNSIGLYSDYIRSEAITAKSHMPFINTMNLSTSSSVVYTPPPGHEYIQTTTTPKYTEGTIDAGERHKKIDDEQNSNELEGVSTKKSVVVSPALSNAVLGVTPITEPTNFPLVLASVESPIMSTGVSTVVSAEVTGEMSSPNDEGVSNERSSESQVSNMVEGVTCQDLQMVLDHNGTYSLIPRSHLPLFLHQSNNNVNGLLLTGKPTETVQTREFSPATTTITDTAWLQNQGMPNIPTKQMKSIIPANLQKLKQKTSAALQRDQALPNKTNPIPLSYDVVDKTTLGQQLNQNSQQKVILTSSIGTTFTTNQHNIMELDKRRILTKPHPDNQTSLIMLSDKTGLTQKELEIAQKLSVNQLQNVLESSKHAAINSELIARTGSLCSENMIFTGSQKHVPLPVCLKPGLSRSDHEQEPVNSTNLAESEDSNMAVSLQQNILLDQNRSLEKQQEMKGINKQCFERMGKTSSKNINTRDEMFKYGVSLVQQNLVEKLKEAQIPQKLNSSSARGHAETRSTGRCEAFEKSIAIQTDPVSVDQNVNNENDLSYVTSKKTGSYNLEHDDMFHNDEHSENISDQQEQDLDHENSNDQILIEPANIQKSNRHREQVQNPVSEFLLAQDSLNGTSNDLLNRDENDGIPATSSSLGNQDKEGNTEQVMYNSTEKGIQYIVEETPQAKYCVPVTAYKGMATNQAETTKHAQQTRRQVTPTSYKEDTLQEPEDNHYSVHLQSIDVTDSKTIDRQVIQIVGTPDGYYEASSQKKTSGSGSAAKKNVNKPVKEKTKKYICTFDTNCNFSSVYHKDLKRHIRTHTGEKPFCCGMCEKRFSRLDKLRLHIRAHTGERPFQCDVCEYRAVDASTLKKHVIIHTDQKPHICQLCNYKCRTSSQLTVHLRTHTGDRPFPCPYCSSKFMIKSDLRRHVRTHTGEKPFQCDKCEVKCTTQGNLHSHIKIHHSEERQLKCADCDYKTSSKRCMRDHARSHESIDTDNICQICFFKCVNLESLKRHLEMHKKEYYTCSHCDFFTRHSATLESHIKRKHSEHFYENKTKRTSSSSRSNKKPKGDNDKKHSKNDKLVYSKFQRLYECDRCNESFVRKDSLKSHLRLHDELSSNNLKLATAMTVLKLQKPVINQERYQEREVEKEQQINFSGHSVGVQLSSSEDDQMPSRRTARHFYDYENEADYEQQTPDSDISQSHYRQHDNLDIQKDSVSSQHHRRQLNFDDSMSKVHTSTKKRRSLDIPSVSNSSTNHSRLSLKNVHTEHTDSKRSRSYSENIGIHASQRPVCDFSKSQQELLRLDNSERTGGPKIVKHRESSPQMYIINKKSKSEMSRSETASRSRAMTLDEPDIKNQFVEHDGHHTVMIANELIRQNQPPPPPQPQPIFQVPNIQLVQNISLPMVRLPDGQILSAYGGSQIVPEINVEQLSVPRPGNENVQTIQVVAPPNVGVLSPNSNHIESGSTIPMPQVIELVDSLGNPISAQFMVPPSVEAAPEIATIQTVNITGLQEHGGVMEQMLSPQHIMTVPLHVLDLPQNK